jgi:two-component system, NarL family, invasion response regulator UvrY
MMINVFIADDHAMVREGLKLIISNNKSLFVVGEASNGNETLRKIRDDKIDVLLLDVSMPGPGFFEILKRINNMVKSSRPKKILVLSANSEEQYAMRSLKAGANGYLAKEHSPEELIKAIIKLHKGGKYITQSFAENMLDIVLGSDKKDGPLHDYLSNREYQIFNMLGNGDSVKTIATTLSLSSKTISTYRSRILQKMVMKSNADIIRYIIGHELS